MPDPTWLAATRRALAAHPLPTAPWTDADLEPYRREGFGPVAAAAELAFRDAAGR